MSQNGISTLLPKSARAAAKLALADTKRSSSPATVSDNSVVWSLQIYEPETFIAPKATVKWQPSLVVALDTYIDVDGVFYKCTTAGTTGAIAPTWIATFGYRPLNSLVTAQIDPPRPTPLVQGRPWEL